MNQKRVRGVLVALALLCLLLFPLDLTAQGLTIEGEQVLVDGEKLLIAVEKDAEACIRDTGTDEGSG